MAEAKRGDTIKVHYTGKLDDGAVFDSSVGREPLEFTIGAGQVIPGFEQPMVGMKPGETKTITVPAQEAYGQRNDEMTMAVDRSQFPEDFEPEVGDQLQVRRPDGNPMIVTIVDVNEEVVILDANHPLAGKDLTFDVEMVEVNDGMRPSI